MDFSEGLLFRGHLRLRTFVKAEAFFNVNGRVSKPMLVSDRQVGNIALHRSFGSNCLKSEKLVVLLPCLILFDPVFFPVWMLRTAELDGFGLKSFPAAGRELVVHSCVCLVVLVVQQKM